MSYTTYDVEKNQGYAQTGGSSPQYGHDAEKSRGSYEAPDNAVPGEAFIVGDSWYARTMRFADGLGVEARGIERVPENERTDTGFKGLLNVATMVCMRYFH